MVDQHMLTGESQPVEKVVGDRVFATTIVCAGRLYIRAETTGRDTVASQIAEVLQHTANFTASIESQGQQIADKTVIPTLTLSALSFPLVGTQGTVALLNSGFLDNMRIIWPLSTLNYLRFAYDAGIFIKDGRSFQLLRQVDTIVFDKTGTLTTDRLNVREIYPRGGVTSDEVLACAATAEYRQTHPIARAILDEAERRGQSAWTIDHAQYEAGYGIIARTGEQAISVGSKRFQPQIRTDSFESIPPRRANDNRPSRDDLER
jgi:Cu2+-exporting ATPase